MAFEPLKMDAQRICDGLSRIGYTPPAALTDIMDNAVNAGAKNLHVLIVREKEAPDTRRNNVKAYCIIDDGKGMDEAGIRSALTLGSPDVGYSADTLSKFGLGLKSASFSQGEVLEVISSDGSSPFLKFRVSLPQIRDEGAYGAEQLELNDEDTALIAQYLPANKGTVIRISDIRKGNHPSVKSTVSELQDRIGVIYYYFMKEGSLNVEVDGKLCPPVDVLFVDEVTGSLDEDDWNGKEVPWIQQPMDLTLDAEQSVIAKIEVTQLPHPPSFAIPPGNAADQTSSRAKFHIEAGNYGYYVYRNKRLISWAERFSGTGSPIIPQDNDFYSFRGRLLLDSNADDVINLDVKKSQIMLSDEAYKALDDVSAAYRRKSKKAWKHAGEEKKRIERGDTIGTVNRIIEQVEIPDELIGDPDSEEDYRESEERAREIVQEQKERFEGKSKSISTETLIMGENADPNGHVFLVLHTQDNSLWEPYYDAVKGNCVRINEFHQFAQTIYQDNSNNSDLHIFFNLMLLQFAAAEVHIQRKMLKFERKDVEVILAAFRRAASEFLATLCRDKPDALPHDE